MEINEQYLEDKTINIISSTIRKSHVIQLQQFLKDDGLPRILKPERVDELMTGIYERAKIKTDTNNLRRFLGRILNKNVKNIRLELRIFKKGNYTILNDKENNHPIIIMDLTNEWNDDYGGQTIFTDGKGNNIIAKHSFNSAIISDGKMMNFTKYINHKAKSNKSMLYGEIQ